MIYGCGIKWRYMYGKPNVPKASPDIAAEVCSELADLQRNEDWDAAVQLVVEAGDPRAQHLATNDWYRLRRSYEIIKVISYSCLFIWYSLYMYTCLFFYSHELR